MKRGELTNQNWIEILNYCELFCEEFVPGDPSLTISWSAGRLQMQQELQELPEPRRARGALRLRPRTSPATDDCSRRRRWWTRWASCSVCLQTSMCCVLCPGMSSSCWIILLQNQVKIVNKLIFTAIKMIRL